MNALIVGTAIIVFSVNCAEPQTIACFVTTVLDARIASGA